MSFFSKVHERILRKFILHQVDFVLIGGHPRFEKDFKNEIISTI